MGLLEKKLKYKRAVQKFIENVKNDREIIGILITGSYVNSGIDKNSDVDIHLILNEKTDYRERGNLWIDDVEIEYFKNPPRQIRSYFEKEKESPHTADMFVNSIVEYKISDVIDDLIEEAKLIIESQPKKLSDTEKELSKYHLDDLQKDLDDCLVKKDRTGFHFVKNKIIDECIFIVCRFYQIRRTKEKRLFARIEHIDSEFAKLIEEVLEEDILQTDKMNSLIKYTENLLGGKREKDWVLKSGLDL
jgi:predicted nucleotidyltransferase